MRGTSQWLGWVLGVGGAHHKRFRRVTGFLVFLPTGRPREHSYTIGFWGWGLAIKGGEALTELVVSLLSLFEYVLLYPFTLPGDRQV